MPAVVTTGGNPKQISSSTLVRTGGGTLVGIFCSSAAASSRISIADAVSSTATTTGGLIVRAFAASASRFYPITASFGTGLFVSLTGSARQVTVIYQPGSP